MGKYSDYKGVTYGRNKNSPWVATYMTNGHNWRSCHKTERAAALAYDIKMVKICKEPVNILKRK